MACLHHHRPSSSSLSAHVANQGHTISGEEEECSELGPVLRIAQTGTVYEYDWYPHMNSQDPATCCFLSTACRQPVHLWDAFTGGLRASYTCLDQYHELTTAVSCAFNANGSRVYCGQNKRITVFDTTRPGRQCSRTILTADLGHSGSFRELLQCLLDISFYFRHVSRIVCFHI